MLSIAFRILRTNRVPPDIFRQFLTVFHGFLFFSPFTAHFCGKRHDFELERSVSEKIVALTTKMCGERAKRGESREKPSKMSENVGWYPIWCVKCGKRCSTIQHFTIQRMDRSHKTYNAKRFWIYSQEPFWVICANSRILPS